MKLASIQSEDGPRAVLVVEDGVIDLAASEPGLSASLTRNLEMGGRFFQLAEQAIRKGKAERPAGMRFLPPVFDPPKIICLGLNYRDHAAETGAAIPKEPVVFSKFATTLIGHEAEIVLPAVSDQVDFEAELVAVIGKHGRHIATERAMEHVAGYTIGHDVSARDWQKGKDQRQWLLGKSFDTFAPTGPYLVTADAINDPHELGISLRLNGETMQKGNTADMIFRLPEVIAYVSRVFTLQAGDLLFTGTPAGVGFTRKPPVFLKAGDEVEIAIDGLGLLRNRVVAG